MYQAVLLSTASFLHSLLGGPSLALPRSVVLILLQRSRLLQEDVTFSALACMKSFGVLLFGAGYACPASVTALQLNVWML